MIVRSLVSSIVEAGLLSLVFLFLLSVGEAQIRTSPSYGLESDSINFGGGLSTSSSYTLESTAGEIATGEGASAAYALRAGYQQMQAVFLSISTPDSVVMSPSIGGLSGGTANGSTSVVVLTDSPSGYELTLQAESAPALRRGSETIADYVPVASPDPDLNFTTSALEAHFGFTPEGADIIGRFRDNGIACGVGSGDTPLSCWLGLTDTPILIASGPANQPDGTETTLNFRVEVGSSAPVVAGEYIATSTLTALPL